MAMYTFMQFGFIVGAVTIAVFAGTGIFWAGYMIGRIKRSGDS